MAGPFIGVGSCIGAGEEGTWGTPVARSVWFPTVSWGVQRKPKRVPRAHLSDVASGRNRKSHYLASDLSGGPFTVDLTYEGAGMLLKHLMGAVATTGAGPYEHTFTLARALPTGLTLEGILGDSGSSEVFSGCLLAKGTLTIETGKVATLACDVIGKTSGGRVAAGSAVDTGSWDMPVLFSDAGDVTWNAVTFATRKLEITVDNKLATRMFVGTVNTRRPAPGDFQDVLVKLDLEYEGNEAWSGFVAGTTDDLDVVFTSGANSLTVQAANAFIEDVSDPINSAGIISQTVSLRCQAVVGGSEGLNLRLVNGQASAIAP